ncbi:TrkA family potassium uptake protein [Actinoplanes sp. NPDC049118]|uniref:potassium channel family protein n=1 Tax=Actinoplanes sp. NPDC049118 TaxID=3155769 RepID=UPI0033D141A0
MARGLHEGAVLVVGLGRFGSALAEDLQRLGHDVLAVDRSFDLVQEWSDQLTHVTQADATSATAMRQIGAHEVDVAVVAIGTGIEASLLSTGVLVDLGVREVWAKAITTAHGRLLERIGAGHVVYPERDTGRRVAHLLNGRLIDYIEFDDGYAIVKVRAPRATWDKTLAESALRTRYGVTVVGVKSPGEAFNHALPDTGVREGDLLIVSGARSAIERFAVETST